ncbi:MAG: tRNA (adenosine(37)-N6)-threonylcarbamoyltransferase complex ATPase subunit type 1 TsaE [Planctomycetota bacterium]
MPWTDQNFAWSVEFENVDLPTLDRLAETVFESTRNSFLSADVPRVPVPIGLVGTLGAGKTRWTQGFASAMGADEQEVTSPTFTLVQSHSSSNGWLDHVDAYRIADEDEWYEAGLEEVLFEPRHDQRPGYVTVEWADRFFESMPQDTLWVEIRLASGEDAGGARRTIRICGPAAAQPVANQLLALRPSLGS